MNSIDLAKIIFKKTNDIWNDALLLTTKKDTETDKIKTTNVNILLNRVRLDRKRTLKKRIIFSLFLALVISAATVYFIIY